MAYTFTMQGADFIRCPVDQVQGYVIASAPGAKTVGDIWLDTANSVDIIVMALESAGSGDPISVAFDIPAVKVNTISTAPFVAGDILGWNGTAFTNVLTNISGCGIALEAKASAATSSVIKFVGNGISKTAVDVAP
jgi:hypothetical protein